jgi:oligoribonuclease
LSFNRLLWIDLEMTGLDPDKHHILEVAAIITDMNFHELALYDAVIKQPASVLKHMEDWSRDHHKNSGLLERVPDGKSEKAAEADLLDLINGQIKGPVVLAGNSIHHDRRFIRRYMPELEAKLHYRMVDVSAWKSIIEVKFNYQFKKNKNHRALEDVRESIAELKVYVAHLKF